MKCESDSDSDSVVQLDVEDDVREAGKVEVDDTELCVKEPSPISNVNHWL